MKWPLYNAVLFTIKKRLEIIIFVQRRYLYLTAADKTIDANTDAKIFS